MKMDNNSLCGSWVTELVLIGKDFWEKDFGYSKEELAAWLM